jgi:hypothetical protein
MLKEGKNNVKTVLLHLVRFANLAVESNVAYIVPQQMLDAVCAHLASAKDHVLVETDLRTTMV